MKFTIEKIKAMYDERNIPCNNSGPSSDCSACSFKSKAPEMVGVLLTELEARTFPSESDKRLLQAIWEYMDDTGDGAPDSSSLTRQNLNFSEPLHNLIKRLKK